MRSVGSPGEARPEGVGFATRLTLTLSVSAPELYRLSRPRPVLLSSQQRSGLALVVTSAPL